MKIIKIICIVFVAAIVATVGGFVIYNEVTTVDFGEIAIENIPQKSEDTERIISFNLRCADDEEGSVKNRSKIALAIIEQYEPDSFGVQEATGKWMKILNKNLVEKYACVTQPRSEDPNSETSAVFYLKDKFELVDSGTIWLSETPDVPYTKHEDSGCVRIATWATLKTKGTEKVYTHINTHLDHVSDEAREFQAEVLNKKIRELSETGIPVICTGDFNTDRNSAVYKSMLEYADDARSVAVISEDGITYHDYGAKDINDMKYAIDFIFVPKGVTVENYKVINDTAKGMYPSDHYPIVADVEVA